MVKPIARLVSTKHAGPYSRVFEGEANKQPNRCVRFRTRSHIAWCWQHHQFLYPRLLNWEKAELLVNSLAKQSWF